MGFELYFCFDDVELVGEFLMVVWVWLLRLVIEVVRLVL